VINSEVKQYKTPTVWFFALFVALLASCIFLFCGGKSSAWTTTDAGAASLLGSSCTKAQTYHIMYIDNDTPPQQNGNSVTFYLKARSYRCPQSSTNAPGVSNTLISYNTSGGNHNVPVPLTFYSGLTLAPGQFSNVYRQGPFTLSNLPVGSTTISYSFRVTSFSNSSNIGNGSGDAVYLVDLCTNVPGVQYPSIPSGMMQSGSECYTDVCTNIPGLQITIPAGYTQSGSECYVDQCPNIAGLQISIPPGMIKDGSGNCVTPDVCANIAGNQASVPPGYTQSGSSCLFPAPSCTLNTSNILYGANFTMNASIRNNSTATLDVKLLSYSGQVSGNANNTNDIAGTSTGTYSSGTHQISQVGTFNIAWSITYGTQYGDQTRSLNCNRLNVTNQVPVATVIVTCSANGGKFSVAVRGVGDPDSPNTNTQVTASVPHRLATTTFSANGYGDDGSATLSLRDGASNALSGRLFDPVYGGTAASRTVSVTVRDVQTGTVATINAAPYVCTPLLECEISQTSVSVNEEFFISVILRNNTGANIPVSGPATYEIYNSSDIRIFNGNGYPYNTATNSYYSPDYPQTILANNGSLTIRSKVPPSLRVSATGKYDVSWVVQTQTGPPALYAIGDCSPTHTIPSGPCTGPGCGAINATAKPYARFYGNDVIAGGGYGATCSVSGTPGALGNGSYTGTQPHATYKGSAAELAVFATGQIDGVLPGSQDTTRLLGSSLSFANSSDGTGSLPFGGNFAASMCVDDFWASRPPDTEMTLVNSSPYTYTVGATSKTAALLNLSALPVNTTGNYYYNGPEIHIYASAPLPQTRRITLYITGTAYIGTDVGVPSAPASAPTSISYANTAGWANKESIPLFKLVTLGNIIIDNDIRSLDGFFIAVENSSAPTPGTTGEIHTCGTIDSDLDLTRPTFDTAQIATNCNSQLVVNGAFIAKRTKLLRILGDVSSAPLPPEPSSSATIAEVFRFSPELYLSLLGDSTIQNTIGSFDSIVSLPPAL